MQKAPLCHCAATAAHICGNGRTHRTATAAHICGNGRNMTKSPFSHCRQGLHTLRKGCVSLAIPNVFANFAMPQSGQKRLNDKHKIHIIYGYTTQQRS
jgi:hypothetical protein